MTDPIAVPDLLSRIDQWHTWLHDGKRTGPPEPASDLLWACRIVLGQQQAQIDRLSTQAQEISVLLSDAQVPACTLPEGVRYLVHRVWMSSQPPLSALPKTLPWQWNCPHCNYGEYKNRDDWGHRLARHVAECPSNQKAKAVPEAPGRAPQPQQEET